MTDVRVRATAVRWVSDDQPGWMEVRLVDAYGYEHRIIEKVPVLTTADITADATFPFEIWIGADARSPEGGRASVTLAWSVMTTDDITDVDCSVDDLVWP